jgi:hypothetical protein
MDTLTMAADTKKDDDFARMGEMQRAIFGLHGIFTALNAFVIDRVAADTMHESDIRDCVNELIVAGEELGKLAMARF